MAMEEKQQKKAARSSFSGRFGYVMAVVGSAVGLGSIWRFPYLAAQYGGGIFLIVYLVLTVTFGHTLLMSETALGRMTQKSPVGAFESFGKKLPFRLGGWINAIVPMLIVPYYCVIGGWVIKYLFEYLVGNSTGVAVDGYYSSFVASFTSVEVCFLLFAAMTIIAVYMGVSKGVEKVSTFMMPLLVVLGIVVSFYSVTRPGAWEGVKFFFIPNFSKFSIMTVVAAMGQMFYSLSIAMGVLYTYGSYIKKDVDVNKTSRQVEFFDTAISLLSGLMIIPAVFAFSGGNAEMLQSGPALMFITLPKVFESMGFERIVGIVFFVMVVFAALPSSISLMESGVSTFMDQTGWSRKKSCTAMGAIILLLGTACALGQNLWSFIQPFGMSILDFFDFLTSSILMPIAAIATCLLIVRAVGVRTVIKEIQQSSNFNSGKFYDFSVRFLAPVFLIVILLSSIAGALGWINI